MFKTTPAARAPRLLAGLAALLGVLVTAAPSAAATAPPGFRPFAPDSIWNLPLRDDAPLHPDSARHAAWVAGQARSRGGWVNNDQCGMPLYWADADTPRVRVRLDGDGWNDPQLARAWRSVPIPAEARTARCGDDNFAVAQVQRDGRVSLWEFWNARRSRSGQWTADHGGATSDVQADRGVASPLMWQDELGSIGRPWWNVTASSISMVAGVITAEDVAAGRIDHALSVAMPKAAKSKWLWPAQRTDGATRGGDAVPQGARLRLDPRLDLSTIAMPPLVRMIAEAAQRHGIVVRDLSWDRVAFYTDGRFGDQELRRDLLGGQWPNHALEAFPWERLQLLDAPTCNDWGRPCTVTPEAVISVDARAQVGEPLALDTANSVLEHPRTKVEWDVDGDGSYETDAGTAVSHTFTPGRSGSRTVRVRITTRDGQVVVGSRSLDVRP